MADNKSIWIGRIFGNMRIKLVALLLATVTWYVVHQAINFEINVDDIPVRVLLPEGWTIQEKSTDKVAVRFRGAQADIQSLRPDTIKIIVEGKAARGEQIIEFIPRHVKAPGGVRPLSIKPDKIVFRADEESEKAVPVKAEVIGEPPLGFEMGEISVQPATVNITGPFGRLDEIQEIRTAQMDLQGRRESFKAHVGLVAPNATWVVRMDPEKVNVQVSIKEHSSNIELDDVPVGALTDPATQRRVIVDPARVKVVLKGQTELLEKLDVLAIRAYVDCSMFTSSVSTQIRVHAYAPPPIKVERVEPDVVNVKVE